MREKMDVPENDQTNWVRSAAFTLHMDNADLHASALT